MRVLVVYASNDGQTRKIARRIAQVLERTSLSVELVDAASRDTIASSIADFGAALLLGAVRMGRHPQALIDFVRTHREALKDIPNAFVSVSLSAGRDKPSAKREVAKTFHDFIFRTGWRPDAEMPVAGALLYTKYTLRIRLLMKFISWLTGGDTDTSRDYEYTDWDAVEDFALRFASALAQAPEARAEMELR